MKLFCRDSSLRLRIGCAENQMFFFLTQSRIFLEKIKYLNEYFQLLIIILKLAAND